MLPVSISPGGVPVASYLPGKFKITSESGSVSFQITASTLELRLHEILSTLEEGSLFFYSPLTLLSPSLAGFQSQMLWEPVFLVQDLKARESDMEFGLLVP